MLAIRAGRAFDGEHSLPGGALVLTDDERIVTVEPRVRPRPRARTSSSSRAALRCRD